MVSNALWEEVEVSGKLTINGGKTTAVAGTQTVQQAYYYGESGITYGFYAKNQGLYVNGGELIVEASNGEPAVFGDSNCEESIIGDEVGIVGNDTTVIDHADQDMTSVLKQYTKLYFTSGISYVDENGGSHTVPGKEITVDTTDLDAAEICGGTFFTREDLIIEHSLVVTGDVKLIVDGGKNLTVTGDASNKAGINVPSGSSLTLYSGKGETAKLTAYGYAAGSGAGIGTNASTPCGAITMNGCNVTANGTGSSPGIGGSSGNNGKIIINAGTIEATAGSTGSSGAAGIGSGQVEIIINNGNITAAGSDSHPGIGSNDSFSIVINGGSVSAKGGSNGTGIGGGQASSGEILINDGTVNAKGQGKGAGIGGSAEVSVTINKGEITAQGGSGSSTGASGIGGYNNCGNGLITINGGTINATGGAQAAGIGTGRGNTTVLTGKTICINNGTITSTGGYDGAGIGGGFKGEATDVIINGGTITAKGGSNGAGIGSGKNGKVASIQLNNGLIKATAGNSLASAIGKGANGTSGTVLADAEELVWAAANEKASKERAASISNDGSNLASALEGKQFAYANHSLYSEGFNIEAYIGTKVPQEDRETIENNLDQIAITVIDRVKRRDAQIEILSRVLEDDYPDESTRLDYINSVLRDENKAVNIGMNIEIKVQDSNLSGGDAAFIEYALLPEAIVTDDIKGTCELTIEDFRNQPSLLEVTMPTCGGFVPITVSHTNEDGSITYEIFSADGTKKFSYNSEAKTVTVNIDHCSNLKVSAKKSENVNTGVTENPTMLPVILGLTLLAIGSAVVLAKRSL